MTSRVGTKAAALKAKPESYLQHFGEEPLSEATIRLTEKYLVKVVDLKSGSETFDELRYKIYTTKGKSINNLPPTSSSLKGHLLRCHYFANMCLSLLNFRDFNLLPTNYGWSYLNGMLTADKNLSIMPAEFLTKCGCKKSCTKNCGCERRGMTCKCENCENV